MRRCVCGSAILKDGLCRDCHDDAEFLVRQGLTRRQARKLIRERWTVSHTSQLGDVYHAEFLLGNQID